MRIAHNISALNTNNSLNKNQSTAQKVLEKLSSGYKINRAGDDAAGLAISEKMRSQIRGLNMASKNIQDGISLVQTAEGALQEIHSLLQRGRELMVQAANDTNTDDDREMIQSEVIQIVKEIDRISDTTHFNNIALLKTDILPPPIPGGGGGGGGGGTWAGLPPEPAIADSLPQVTLDPSATLEEKIATVLKYSMLEQGEKRIQDYFGLQASNVTMNVGFSNEPNASYLAYVSYYLNANGEGTNLSLVINKGYFQQAEWPDGGTYPMYLDRVITHELTHAVMAVTTNFASLPGWFKEGTAEFIHGADERLAIDVYYSGVNGVINTIGDISTSAGYSAGYTAVRYLHDKLQSAGGIKGLMSKLTETDPNTGNKKTLDVALNEISNGMYSNTNAFVNDFKANGASYLQKMIDDGLLQNEDTGAIGGADADQGPIFNARTVVDDTLNYQDQPLDGFTLNWPSGLESTNVGTITPFTTLNSGFNYWQSNSMTILAEVKIQLGANSNQATGIQLTTINSTTLGIQGVNAVTDANAAIAKFDDAIKINSSKRSYFGAIQNRLEHAYENVMNTAENLTAAESRIRDVDMAKEMMNFTKMNILMQATQSMLSQANQQPQGVLQLLNA